MTCEEAYRVLTELITKGFLTVGVEMDGKLLVFKTVNESEYGLIRLWAGVQDKLDYYAMFNLYFLSFSLLMVDGEYMLTNREAHVADMFKMFSRLPNQTCVALMKKLEGIRNTAFDATKYVEGFCYTDRSRAMWDTACGRLPNDPALTGVPGTDRIGLNAHQESWIYINRMLDDEEKYNADFEMSVMIASATNPKGARQIRAKHDTAVKNAEDRRIKMARQGYIETKKAWRPDGWAAPVDTTEELLAELDREMNGVKDKHDIFMENYLKKLKDNAQARAREAKERIEEARRKTGDVPDLDGSQRILSPREMAEVFAANKNRRPGVVDVRSDDAASPEDANRYLNKIGSRVLTARK